MVAMAHLTSLPGRAFLTDCYLALRFPHGWTLMAFRVLCFLFPFLWSNSQFADAILLTGVRCGWRGYPRGVACHVIEFPIKVGSGISQPPNNSIWSRVAYLWTHGG